VAECETGMQAVQEIRSTRPDLVFLDIEMPGFDGLHVAERFKTQSLPVVVFVTAHDRYAVEAFRVRASDFVLKPLNDSRIGEVVDRAVQEIRTRRQEAFQTRFQTVLTRLERNETEGMNVRRDEGVVAAQRVSREMYLRKLAIKERGRIRLVDVPTIDWIEACGNYVNLHVGGSKHLVRETMNGMETRLDPSLFMRIHRSTIVNIRSVAEFRPFFNGSFLIVLKNQTQLYSSRGYHPKLDRFLTALQ
jgi:two-component system LytT family response regulator